MTEDAKQIADRYIERGGYARGERSEKLHEDILHVLSYLGWSPDSEYWGGHRADDTFKAFCRILSLDPIAMRKIVRGGP